MYEGCLCFRNYYKDFPGIISFYNNPLHTIIIML